MITMNDRSEQVDIIEEVSRAMLRAQLDYFFDQTMDDRKNIPLSRKLIETVTEYVRKNGVPEEEARNVRHRLREHAKDIFLQQCRTVHEEQGGEVDDAYRNETIDYFNRIYERAAT